MVGSKGKLQKKQLNKKSGSGKKKKTSFKFNRGTTHVFRFEEKDIGNLVSVTIEVNIECVCVCVCVCLAELNMF